MEWADPITRQLESIHREFASDADGEVATYIPELATANPAHFGIALVSLAGNTYRAGYADVPFTIQSVSKPFVYALALEEAGIDVVLDRVGVEPSGEAFNAISLEPGTGRPANPMINAGAILTTSLIPAVSAAERMDKVLAMLSAFAGRDLDIDEAVYRSELLTGDRNRALAYLMKNAGALREDVDETLDVYFRSCAISVTAVDIAVMAATLANKGVNPVTGVHVVDAEVASQILTVMATCGMYEYSGRWLVNAGMPAKSGVSGALVAASPGQFGLGLFSPLLDAQGNSVRGVAACTTLARQFELQVLRRPGKPAPAMYMVDLEEYPMGWTGDGISPRLVAEQPSGLIVRGLQGDISFTDAEVLLRSFDTFIGGNQERQAFRIVLDLHRVGTSCRSSTAILTALSTELVQLGHKLVVVDIPGRELIPGVDSYPTLASALDSPGRPFLPTSGDNLGAARNSS